jgi:hypothetical protein
MTAKEALDAANDAEPAAALHSGLSPFLAWALPRCHSFLCIINSRSGWTLSAGVLPYFVSAMPHPTAANRASRTKIYPSDEDRERFRSSYVVEPAPTLCWRWTGPMTGKYPRFQFEGKATNAGRFAYRADPLRNPIPSDQPMLRRRCRNKLCVNPAHLDPVDDVVNAHLGLSPSAENARKQFCPAGHELTPENTIVEMAAPFGRPPRKRRRCKECSRSSGLNAPDATLSPEHTAGNRAGRAGAGDASSTSRRPNERNGSQPLRWFAKRPPCREGSTAPSMALTAS